MPQLPQPDNPGYQEHVHEIQRLAKLGRAPGQCEYCRSYRLDGEPPILHERGCPRTDNWRDSPGLGLNGTPQLIKKTYDAHKVGVMGQFSRELLEWTTEENPVQMHLVAKLHTYVLRDKVFEGTDHHVVACPATWWQHLKADHFPGWFRRRWPVRYHQTQVDFAYQVFQTFPEADVPAPPEFGKAHHLVEVVLHTQDDRYA